MMDQLTELRPTAIRYMEKVVNDLRTLSFIFIGILSFIMTYSGTVGITPWSSGLPTCSTSTLPHPVSVVADYSADFELMGVHIHHVCSYKI